MTNDKLAAAAVSLLISTGRLFGREIWCKLKDCTKARRIRVLLLCIFSVTNSYGSGLVGTHLPERAPLYITPTVEGIYACDDGLAIPQLTDIDAVNDYCIRSAQDGSNGIRRMLDQLEPGGPKGQVQVGYLATLQLLSLYRRSNNRWTIDEKKLDSYFNVISSINRPVVIYLAANHFDTQGPLIDELVKNRTNLMQFSDGMPIHSNYFGYRVIPFTLQVDSFIEVNIYRKEALRHVANRISTLPKLVRDRIIAITFAGELHQMFPDFENGMGNFKNISVTDYSTASIVGFRQWLDQRYGSINRFNKLNSFEYKSFSEIPAPAKDIRSTRLSSFGEHYDAYADGVIPISGWIWDPTSVIKKLELYVNGRLLCTVKRGFNRLDVYRAINEVTNPNTGYRSDIDFSRWATGHHLVQVIARTDSEKYLLGKTEIHIISRDQSPPSRHLATGIEGLKSLSSLKNVKFSLDLPGSTHDYYFNPLARDWNNYRAWQVRQFMEYFYRAALLAGLPADKLFSHQIVPSANSSWNSILFSSEQTLARNVPWKLGFNLYGGATDGLWLQDFLTNNEIREYGVPEFNPQQWKSAADHQQILLTHYKRGAKFISPYYLSAIPDRYKSSEKNGVNAMEIRPDNQKDGSDQLFNAIKIFASH